MAATAAKAAQEPQSPWFLTPDTSSTGGKEKKIVKRGGEIGVWHDNELLYFGKSDCITHPSCKNSSLRQLSKYFKGQVSMQTRFFCNWTIELGRIVGAKTGFTFFKCHYPLTLWELCTKKIITDLMLFIF